jgi:hypothetical protein
MNELGVREINSFTQTGQVSIEDNNDSEVESSVTQDDDEKYTNVKSGKHKGKGASKKVERRTKKKTSKEATHHSSFNQIEGGEVEDEEETNNKPKVKVEKNTKEFYQAGSANNIQRIPSISQVVPEAVLAAPLPRVTGMTNNQNTLPPIKTPPLSNNNSNTTLPSINNWRAETSEKTVERIPSITIKKMEPRHERELRSSSGRETPHNERNSKSMNEEKGSNMQPKELYMGYSNLNQDSDEETNYKPQIKSELSSGSTGALKRSANDLTEDSVEEKSVHENEVEEKSNLRTNKRPRRRSVNVQRAIEDEQKQLHSSAGASSKKVKKSSSSTKKTPPKKKKRTSKEPKKKKRRRRKRRRS